MSRSGFTLRTVPSPSSVIAPRGPACFARTLGPQPLRGYFRAHCSLFKLLKRPPKEKEQELKTVLVPKATDNVPLLSQTRGRGASPDRVEAPPRRHPTGRSPSIWPRGRCVDDCPHSSFSSGVGLWEKRGALACRAPHTPRVRVRPEVPSVLSQPHPA